jgi:large subunit ribosomal protein L10
LKITEKQKIADELKSKFVKANAIILTDYKGLNVESINLLRRKLREIDVEYKVVKNSLLSRASIGTSIEKMKEIFKGPSAIALSYEDPVHLAKVLVDFSSNYDVFEVKGGILEEKFLDVDQIKLLASLPSKEILYSNLLRTINAAPVSFVTLLSKVISSFIVLLEALKESKK